MINSQKKSQIIVEFMMLYAVILVVTILFVESVNQNKDLHKTKDSLLAEDVGLKIQNEIGLTSFAEDGYSRQFKLPQKIGDKEYNVSIANNTLAIRTNSTLYITRILNVTGYVKKDSNTITKTNGMTYINDAGGGGDGGEEGGGADGPLDEIASQLTANINKSLPADWHGAQGDKDNIVLKLFSDVSYDVYLESFTLSWSDSTNRFVHFQHLTEANGWSKRKIYGDVNEFSPVNGVFDDLGDPDENLKIPANEMTIIDDLHFKNNIKLPAEFTLTLSFSDSTSSTLRFTIS